MTDSANGHDANGSQHPHGGGLDSPKPTAVGFDSEIDVKHVIEVAVWLAATTIVALVVGYFLYKGLGRWSDRQDPKASPLAEANVRIEPPEPHLQAKPEAELALLRRANRDRLSSWGWVDKSAGVAHMPIDEAIARLAVPEPATDAPPVAPETPAPSAAPAAPAEPAHGGGH